MKQKRYIATKTSMTVHTVPMSKLLAITLLHIKYPCKVIYNTKGLES